MLNFLKKKPVVIGLFALALVVTSYLNYVYNAKDTLTSGGTPTPASSGDPAQPASAGEFFTKFRTDRVNTRQQEIAYFDSIIDNPASDAGALKSAQEAKIGLASRMELELIIENLVKAKGFSDAAVTLNEDSINVIVSEAELTQEQVAQILDIVLTESGEDPNNVKIMPLQ